MPYKDKDDESLPDSVKALSDSEREQWVAVFNEQFQSCQDEDGEDCESEAMSLAYGVVKKSKRFLDTLKGWIEKLTRAIKDVPEWDGSASRWPDTDAYCSACLIDVNLAAGRETKAQSHCMLPVRNPGDSASTYVKQAVHAAAGGHGISQVVKPDDVPQDAWGAAVKAAAGKLEAAYKEMGEEVPPSIAELRAITISGIADAAYGQLYEKDEYAWLNDIYADNGGAIFLIVSSKGKLYKVPVTIDENSQVTLGEWQPVSIEFAPRPEPAETEPEVEIPEMMLSRSMIHRQADGLFRWVSVSCSAALNRVGCIDSTKLFDSFIEHAEKTGEYPIRQFYHQGGSFRTGQADFLARDGFALITSGLYDDSDLARAEIQARQADPGYWGDSIGFNPDAVEVSEIADGVSIPVYTRGILTEISTLPEDQAAAWFTNHTDLAEVKRMLQGKVLDAFVKLFNGDEDAAKKWLEGNVDATNRSIIEQGLVARSTEPVSEPQKPAAEIVIEQTVMDELLTQAETRMTESVKPLSENVATLAAALESLVKRFQDLEGAIASQRAEIDSLKRTDEEKRQAWQADLPARSQVSVTYRPRQTPEGEADKPAQSAQGGLSKLPSYPK